MIGRAQIRIRSVASLVAALAIASTTAVAAEDIRPRNPFGEDVLPILQRHCTNCHAGDDAQAGFALDQFPDEQSVLKHRKTWEKLTKLVSTGVMPPADESQLSADDKQKVLDYLEATLFHIDCSKITDPGYAVLHRLNRLEYNNTVRDLLGVTFRPADDFPSDDVGHGFDNIGEILTLPPLLMEKYLNAAEKIAREVIIAVDPSQPERKTFTANQIQRGKAAKADGEGVIIPSVGFALVTWEAPVTGTYLLSVDAAGHQAGDDSVKMEFRLDDHTLLTRVVPNSPDKYETYTHPVQVTRGKHLFAVAFVNDFYDSQTDPAAPRDRNLLLNRFEVRGPLEFQHDDLPEPHRRLIVHHPRGGKTAAECARENLARLLPKAFRRPVSDEEIETYVQLVERSMQQGDAFESAMQTALMAVLVSPHFLFRVESDPPSGEIHPLNDYELATRLSYFLWSSLPDDELFQHAAQGDLHHDAVLEQQVQRMLTDPKSSALVESFADQWLNLRILDQVRPDPGKFPDFNGELKGDLKRETRAFFEYILRENRSVLELLDGPYTFVNNRLAKHYGLPEVSGDQFQKVSLEGTPRAGLMTQGSILTLTSAPTRTSPVKRGKWILEVLLDEPPPPPPPNVPELTETAKTSPEATLRQQLEIHRANPVCASCHQTMDSLGFGMENFDPIGRWRDQDDSKPLDVSGTLPDGRTFAGPKELVGVLMQKKTDFVRALSGKLLTYALGRGLEYYDRCTVDNILMRMEEQDYRFSVLVTEIVKSRPFRLRRGEGTLP